MKFFKLSKVHYLFLLSLILGYVIQMYRIILTIYSYKRLMFIRNLAVDFCNSIYSNQPEEARKYKGLINDCFYTYNKLMVNKYSVFKQGSKYEPLSLILNNYTRFLGDTIEAEKIVFDTAAQQIESSIDYNLSYYKDLRNKLLIKLLNPIYMFNNTITWLFDSIFSNNPRILKLYKSKISIFTSLLAFFESLIILYNLLK